VTLQLSLLIDRFIQGGLGYSSIVDPILSIFMLNFSSSQYLNAPRKVKAWRADSYSRKLKMKHTKRWKLPAAGSSREM
jgi:hypothetical protein